MRILSLILFISFLVSACTSTKEARKEISFSKTVWKVKHHEQAHGPGENYEVQHLSFNMKKDYTF
jgi:hypothetical protein